MTRCKPTLKRGDSGSWTSENENELKTVRPTRSGVSVISNGNATDPLVTLPDRSCTGDPRYELDRPHYFVFDRFSTRKQIACALVKYMDDLLQLIFSCTLRDTEHSMSLKSHCQEHDDSRRPTENRREIQTQQHSKLINILEAEHILQIRESGGHEGQHSRSFHESP